MGLFDRKKTPSDERQEQSQQQMARGGLPLDAERRLHDLASRKTLFTSNLSVNEFVLAAKDGVIPLGQVMGSTIYHIGWQFQRIYQSGELFELTQAYWHARMLALSRLQQEAQILGAHGVIGVRIARNSYSWGQNLLEFTAQGTAIRFSEGDVPEKPFVCALSGQDFYALRQAGYSPVGFCFGTCIYYNVASYSTQWMTQSGWGGGGMMNQEIVDYTQAVYMARHSAMNRLSDEARRVHAEGIVGVTIEDRIETYEVEVNDQPRRDLIVEFTALGTAIIPTTTDLPVIDYNVSLQQ